MATVASLINIAGLGGHTQSSASGIRKSQVTGVLAIALVRSLAAKFHAKPLWIWRSANERLSRRQTAPYFKSYALPVPVAGQQSTLQSVRLVYVRSRGLP